MMTVASSGVGFLERVLEEGLAHASMKVVHDHRTRIRLALLTEEDS